MKILYNVTVNIDLEAEEEWLLWMRQSHIPEVLKTGYFLEARLCKVLSDDMGGKTYSMQYLAPDMLSYKKYIHEEAPRLRDDFDLKYGGRYVAFRTILEVDSVHGQG